MYLLDYLYSHLQGAILVNVLIFWMASDKEFCHHIYMHFT